MKQEDSSELFRLVLQKLPMNELLTRAEKASTDHESIEFELITQEIQNRLLPEKKENLYGLTRN